MRNKMGARQEIFYEIVKHLKEKLPSYLKVSFNNRSLNPMSVNIVDMKKRAYILINCERKGRK